MRALDSTGDTYILKEIFFFFERILGRPAMYFWIIAARIRELGNELADDFLITADRALGILMWTGEKFQHEEIRSLAGRPAANYSAAGQASTLFCFFVPREFFIIFGCLTGHWGKCWAFFTSRQLLQREMSTDLAPISFVLDLTSMT